jgi:hypothetical protein
VLGDGRVVGIKRPVSSVGVVDWLRSPATSVKGSATLARPLGPELGTSQQRFLETIPAPSSFQTLAGRQTVEDGHLQVHPRDRLRTGQAKDRECNLCVAVTGVAESVARRPFVPVATDLLATGIDVT